VKLCGGNNTVKELEGIEVASRVLLKNMISPEWLNDKPRRKGQCQGSVTANAAREARL
jgi:hypothetical protein